MPGWGTNWTDNKMFTMEEEKRRQQAVVKKFIEDHPEYDPQNDDNNKCLVDFIENSKRPFTTGTIEWAYESLKVILQPKKKNILQKISTALNNSNMSVAPPEPIIDPIPKAIGYMTVNVLGNDYNVPYYSTDVKTSKQGTYYSAEQVKDGILELADVIQKEQDKIGVAVDNTPIMAYDKDIAPTKTQRRIKDDDD